MKNLEFPEWSAELRNLYCRRRLLRSWDGAAIRRYYRYIEHEKKRLFAEHKISPMEMHLLTRFFANPRKESARIQLQWWIDEGAQIWASVWSVIVAGPAVCAVAVCAESEIYTRAVAELFAD